MFWLKPFTRQNAAAGAAVYQRALAAAQQTLPQRFKTPSKTKEDRRLRFEAIAAMLAVELTKTKAPELQQAILEAMIEDFDGALREAGIGDLKVGKEVRTYVAATNGRWQTYKHALINSDKPELIAALQNNHAATGKEATTLADFMLNQFKDGPKTGGSSHDPNLSSQVSRGAKQTDTGPRNA